MLRHNVAVGGRVTIVGVAAVFVVGCSSASLVAKQPDEPTVLRHDTTQ